MLNGSANEAGSIPSDWSDLAMLAELLIQSGAQDITADRITIWWRDGESYNGLATGDRHATWPIHQRMPLVLSIGHRYRPTAAHGATTDTGLIVQIPLYLGRYHAGALTLERDRLEGRAGRDSQGLRAFCDRVVSTLYRYQRETALHTMFERDGHRDMPATGAHRSILGYWADGAVVIDRGMEIVDADDRLALLFGYPGREALLGLSALGLFAHATGFALHPGRRSPSLRRLIGVRVGGERFPCLVLPVRYPDRAELTQVMVRDVGELSIAATDGASLGLEPLQANDSIEDVLRSRAGEGDVIGPFAVASARLSHERWLISAYGKEAAMAARQHVLRVLLALRRPGDVLVEAVDGHLVIVVVATATADAFAIVDQMRDAVARLPAPTPRGELHVTLSTGIARCEGPSHLDTAYAEARSAEQMALARPNTIVDVSPRATAAGG